MKRSRLLRRGHRWAVLIAALPLFQFFTGCFPNIPGVPNLPGAINFEIQNLINRTVLDAISVLVTNILNL